MATSGTQQEQAANDHAVATDLAPSAEAERQSTAVSGGAGWWEEFERLERVFFIISGILIAGALVAYLGHWTGNYAITVIGVVVFSLAMVGVASLSYPLGRIAARAFSDWRRRRAAERTHKI